VLAQGLDGLFDGGYMAVRRITLCFLAVLGCIPGESGCLEQTCYIVGCGIRGCIIRRIWWRHDQNQRELGVCVSSDTTQFGVLGDAKYTGRCLLQDKLSPFIVHIVLLSIAVLMSQIGKHQGSCSLD
jgi:hypothetical protein